MNSYSPPLRTALNSLKIQVEPKDFMVSTPSRSCTFEMVLPNGSSPLALKLAGVDAPESLAGIPLFLSVVADTIESDWHQPVCFEDVCLEAAQPQESTRRVTCRVVPPSTNTHREVVVQGQDVPTTRGDVPTFLRRISAFFVDCGVRIPR